MKNLILIGMPGCGKSTLGVLAAKALRMDFVDTDLLMQKKSGKKLQLMVDELGTQGFMEVEERCVRSLEAQNCLIATGGSVALEDGAMRSLRKNGLIVFLQLPYETIEKRLKNISSRGIAMKKGESLRQLYDMRQPAYLKWADETINTDGMDIERAVEMLCALASANGVGIQE